MILVSHRAGPGRRARGELRHSFDGSRRGGGGWGVHPTNQLGLLEDELVGSVDPHLPPRARLWALFYYDIKFDGKVWFPFF